MLAKVLEVLEKSERLFDGCLIAPGYKDSDGYGQISYQGKTWRANRFIWTALQGDIAEGLQVHHKCYNRGCIEIEHLDARTPKSNTLDSPIAVAAVNSRKKVCKHGHSNWAVRADGKRSCLDCRKFTYPSTRRRSAP